MQSRHLQKRPFGIIFAWGRSRFLLYLKHAQRCGNGRLLPVSLHLANRNISNQQMSASCPNRMPAASRCMSGSNRSGHSLVWLHTPSPIRFGSNASHPGYPQRILQIAIHVIIYRIPQNHWHTCKVWYSSDI